MSAHGVHDRQTRRTLCGTSLHSCNWHTTNLLQVHAAIARSSGLQHAALFICRRTDKIKNNVNLLRLSRGDFAPRELRSKHCRLHLLQLEKIFLDAVCGEGAIRATLISTPLCTNYKQQVGNTASSLRRGTSRGYVLRWLSSYSERHT